MAVKKLEVNLIVNMSRNTDCRVNKRHTMILKLAVSVLFYPRKKKNKTELHTWVEFQDSYNLLQFAHNLKMSTTAHQKITKLNTIRIYSP